MTEPRQEGCEEPGASTSAAPDEPVQQSAFDDDASTVLNLSEIFSDRPDILCEYDHTVIIK